MAQREFHDWESILIKKLLSNIDDNVKLLSQFNAAKAENLNPDGSIVSIKFPGQSANSSGQEVLSEGVIFDSDNKRVEIILFVNSNDELFELELVKYEDDDISYPLKLNTLELLK